MKNWWPIRIYLWIITLVVVLLLVNPLHDKIFNLVRDNSGLQLDNESQADHDTARELLNDTIRGKR